MKCPWKTCHALSVGIVVLATMSPLAVNGFTAPDPVQIAQAQAAAYADALIRAAIANMHKRASDDFSGKAVSFMNEVNYVADGGTFFLRNQKGLLVVSKSQLVLYWFTGKDSTDGIQAKRWDISPEKIGLVKRTSGLIYYGVNIYDKNYDAILQIGHLSEQEATKCANAIANLRKDIRLK